MKYQYNIVELFSGIGSQAKALKNIGVAVSIIGTCEWDIHPIVAYDAIHNTPECTEDVLAMNKAEVLEILKQYTLSNNGKEAMDYTMLRTYSESVLRRIYSAIKRTNNFVDINALTGKDLPGNIDILTYSFPCQDLSNVGAFHGYNLGIDENSGSRSSLLWRVGHILNEMKAHGKKLPHFLLMENVPSLLSKRHIGNFKKWIKVLEDLGYMSKYLHLNTSSFGLPQNRPRLFMISVYVGSNKELRNAISTYFNRIDETTVIADYEKSEFFVEHKIGDLLRTNYSNPKILKEALECTPNDTISRRKIWLENPQLILTDGKINPDHTTVRTITTKQDRNPNSGNLYFDGGTEGRSKFRYLTPRECLLFMGFTDEDYQNLIKHNPYIHKGTLLFSRDKIIRMAGNSIPVKLLEGIFLQICYIDEITKLVGMDAYNRKRIPYGNPTLDNPLINAPKLVRDFLVSNNITYHRNSAKFPHIPHFIVTNRRTIIFMFSCFWHGHELCACRKPFKNINFWAQVVSNTQQVDQKLICDLQSDGWNVITLWDCELFTETRPATLNRLLQNILQAPNISND